MHQHLFGDSHSRSGWALFQFLANHVRLRIIFIRDTCHRMSNWYTNALKGVMTYMNAALRVRVVSMFTRAPYGTGKNWGELKGTMKIILDKVIDKGLHVKCLTPLCHAPGPQGARMGGSWHLHVQPIVKCGKVTAEYPVLQMFATEIGVDHDMPAASSSFAHLKRCLSTLLTHTIGPLIQFRRWWSAYDATKVRGR